MSRSRDGVGTLRRFSARYFEETGRAVTVAESGKAVDAGYVDWLEEKLAASLEREKILQEVRG